VCNTRKTNNDNEAVKEGENKIYEINLTKVQLIRPSVTTH